jgi:ribonucleoside-diphosphate reductase alpha chain
MAKSLYTELSEQRKQLQAEGRLPEWYTTAGWQMFSERYLYQADDFKGQVTRIASVAAKHAHRMYGDEFDWTAEFFNLFWDGDLSPSTPVLANMGTDRGFPVSCSGQYIGDSIDDFYGNLRESALLTKMGFGTSAYLGDIRPRGALTSNGFKASGVVPVLDDFVTMSRKVSQGPRRGAWAGYIEPEHGDFWELVQYLRDNVDDTNIGWNLTDFFQSQLNSDDPEVASEADLRWGRINGTKATFGKGYMLFIDKANRNRPEWYKERGLKIKASNLCSEIMLFADMYHTYTCVLSSINIMNWDRIKVGRQVFFSTVFLDCVAEEFIERARGMPGMEKAVRFTEKSRALGLGQCGFHSYLQKNMIPFESFEAHMLNNRIAAFILEQATEATFYMAAEAGEPEWMEGTGRRNSHLIAIAPTKSTALLMGGVSEGINPDPAMTFVQTTAAGEIDRVNPQLLSLMKEKGVYTKKHIQELVEALGSVQGVSWLSPEEKAVFKTAFEIDQRAILRLGSQRQRYICQGQSLNLFFSADEDEGYISLILQEAWEDPYILAVYYSYSQAGVTASKDECLACQ